MKKRKFVRREIAPGATATVAEDAAPETIKALEECVRFARDGIGAFPVATGSDSSRLNEVTIFGVNYDGALNDDDDFDDTKPCPNCSGTGAEPYDDFTTPCEECDGTGTLDA